MQNNKKNLTSLRSFKIKNANISEVSIAFFNRLNTFINDINDPNNPKNPLKIMERIINIIENAGIDRTKITTESELLNDLGLDSLDAVELGMALEEEFKDFNIKISDAEMETIKTVQDAINFIVSKAK